MLSKDGEVLGIVVSILLRRDDDFLIPLPDEGGALGSFGAEGAGDSAKLGSDEEVADGRAVLLTEGRLERTSISSGDGDLLGIIDGLLLRRDVGIDDDLVPLPEGGIVE